MSILKRKRNLVIVGLVAAAVIGAGSVAYAAFESTTTANAYGSSQTLVGLNVDTSKTTIAFANGETGLWPDVSSTGGDPGDPTLGNHVAAAEVAISNPNEVGVTFSSTDIIGTVTFNDSSVQGECGGLLGVAGPTLNGGSVTLGAKGAWNDHATVGISGIYLRWDANNDCAGKAFTTHWTITAHQL